LAQKPITLKKKFYGSYEGEIPAYTLDVGTDNVDVAAVAIKIKLEGDSVHITVGQNALHGVYHVLFEGKNYFVLDCRMDGQLAGERIVVYNRGKRISRDGLYPQPSSFLDRVKD
jgi:ribosomal protein L21E